VFESNLINIKKSSWNIVFESNLIDLKKSSWNIVFESNLIDLKKSSNSPGKAESGDTNTNTCDVVECSFEAWILCAMGCSIETVVTSWTWSICEVCATR